MSLTTTSFSLLHYRTVHWLLIAPAGYPHPERTEDAIWETLPAELRDCLEAERIGGGTIAL